MIRRFFIAVQFLTRLPVPRSLNSSEADIGKAAAFFPLVGLIVGGAAAAVFIGTQKVLPLQAAVLCAVAFAAFLTNGFHEDGLADSFDGFGGGWTKDRVLEIMRDSRIGTYGALGLIFLIFGKIIFLSSLPPAQIWRWFIVGHIAARWTILPLCALLAIRARRRSGEARRQASWSSGTGNGDAHFVWSFPDTALARGYCRDGDFSSSDPFERILFSGSPSGHYGRLSGRCQPTHGNWAVPDCTGAFAM